MLHLSSISALRRVFAIGSGMFLLAVGLSSCGYPFLDRASSFLVAPSALSYPDLPSRLPVGLAMLPATPSLKGKAILFTVEPSLPSGLSLDPATGVISGTPSEATAAATYRVTAASPAGVTGLLLDLAVGSPSLYLAGNRWEGGRYVAVSASDGVASDLPDSGTYNSYATAVDASSGTAFAGGYYDDGTSYVPCFWKGSTRTDLPFVAGHDARVEGMVVVGDHVYSGGYYEDAAGSTFACYWVDTDLVTLPVDSTRTNYADVSAIAEAAGHVYVSGSWWDNALGYYGPDVPCYWVDSTRFDLPVGSGATTAAANAIAVSGGDVYSAGYWYDPASGHDIPCYWKGTTRQDLGDGASDAEVRAIHVGSDHLYLAGYRYASGLSTACYWVDGARIDLQGDGSHDCYATSITVDSGAVYCAGYWYDGTDYQACYWKDGVRVDLSWSQGGDARVLALALK